MNEVAQALGERERAAKRVQEGADKESKLAGAVSREAKKKVAAVQKLGKIMGMGKTHRQPYEIKLTWLVHIDCLSISHSTYL